MNLHELTLKRPVSGRMVLLDRVSIRLEKFLYTRANQLIIDGAIVAAALWVAYMIRFDGLPPEAERRQFALVLPLIVPLYVGVNWLSGLQNRVWRFFSLADAAAMARSTASATFICLLWRIFDPGTLPAGPVPFGVLIIHPFIAYMALVTVRLMRRNLYDRTASAGEPIAVMPTRKRALLIGAGEAGLHVLQQLRKTTFDLVGFLDDDPALQGRSIGGWHVLGSTGQLEETVKAFGVDEVILCMPSASKATLQRIAARCARLEVAASSVPTVWEIVSGMARIDNLRSVNMEDLLGRDSITYQHVPEELTRTYRGSRILVTGAGGSIGSELVRQLKEFKPSRLVLVDKDENSLYEIACETKEEFAEATEVVADIRDRDLMERVFAKEKPEIVFHAAAYKHVPLMERFPSEAILNNVMGTRHLAELSNRFGVRTFALISTDKAVNPTSTMGASKRVAEMLVQSLASNGTKTSFCCVRFGNVLGSRASVVPVFQRQIKQRKNITVTHPEVCRYFMTIPEAVQLVIQAGSLGRRGEIFLLDMGDPVKIVDLARNLIELSGLSADEDVKIEFTGLRPGEKLNEELLNRGEHGVRSTRYSKIFVVEAPTRDWEFLKAAVEELEAAAHLGEADAIRRKLQTLNIGYHCDDPAEPGQGIDEDRRMVTDRFA